MPSSRLRRPGPSVLDPTGFAEACSLNARSKRRPCPPFGWNGVNASAQGGTPPSSAVRKAEIGSHTCFLLSLHDAMEGRGRMQRGPSDPHAPTLPPVGVDHGRQALTVPAAPNSARSAFPLVWRAGREELISNPAAFTAY
jgi:hypothetical protein